MGYYDDIRKNGVLGTIGKEGGVTTDEFRAGIQKDAARVAFIQALDPKQNENGFTKFWNWVTGKNQPAIKVDEIQARTQPFTEKLPGMEEEKPEEATPLLSREEQSFTPYNRTTSTLGAIATSSPERFAAEKEKAAFQYTAPGIPDISGVLPDVTSELEGMKARQNEKRPPASFDPNKGGRFGNLAMGGFTAGLPLPGAGQEMYSKVEPKGFKEKMVYHTAETISAIASLGGLTKVLGAPMLAIGNPLIKRMVASQAAKTLETKFPKLFKLMFGKAGLEPFLQETFKILPSFEAYNQLTMALDSPARERIEATIRTIPDSLIFSRFALMRNMVGSVSSQSAYGFVSTKLAGGTNEDALVQAAIQGGLGAWQVVELRDADMQRNLYKQATEALKETIPMMEPEAMESARRIATLPEVDSAFNELRSMLEDGRYYFASPERSALDEVAFRDIRDAVQAMDHAKVAELFSQKMDDTFKFAGIDGVKVLPVEGVYYGGREGSAVVITDKANPTVEYLMMGMGKHLNQDAVIIGDATPTTKKEHPNLVFRVEGLDADGANRLAQAIEGLTEGKFGGQSRIQDNAYLVSYIPEFASFTPAEARVMLSNLVDGLKTQGFQVEDFAIFDSNNKAIKSKVENPTDVSYDEKLRRVRPKAGLGKLGGEKQLLQGLGEFLGERGLLHPDKLLSDFTGKKVPVPEIPRVVQEAAAEANKSLLKNLDAERVIGHIENIKSKSAEAFAELIAREISGDENITQEAFKELQLSHDVQEMFSDTGVDPTEYQAGWTVAKGGFKGEAMPKLKLSDKEIDDIVARIQAEQDPEAKRVLQQSLDEMTGKVTPEIGETEAQGDNYGFRVAGEESGSAYNFEMGVGNRQLFDRSDFTRFLLDVPRENVSDADISEAVKRYFPNREEAVKTFAKLKEAFENGEKLDSFIFKYKVGEQRQLLEDVLKRFSETDGSLDGFVSALAEQDVTTLQGVRLINAKKKARSTAFKLDFGSAEDLFNAVKEAQPEIFQTVERRALAADVVDSTATDRIQYKTTADEIGKDEQKFFRRENMVEETPENVDKVLYGRKEIVEDFIDRLDVAFRKAKLPKNVEGRAVSDQIIELKGFDTEVAFHEAGHIIDARYNLVKQMPDAIKEAIAKEVAPLLDGLPEKQQTLQEGFARFVADYVLGNNPRQKFPVTTDYFESILGTRAPEILDPLKMARSRFQDLINAPELAAAKAEIYTASDEPIADMVKDAVKNPGGAFDKVKKWVKGTYRDNLNVFNYFNDVDAKLGIKDLTDSTYYRAYTADQRRAGLAHFMMDKGVPDYNSWRNSWSGKERVENITMLHEGGLAELYRSFPVEFMEDVSAFRLAQESMRRFEKAQREGVKYSVNPLFTPQRAIRIMEQVRRKFPGVDAVSAKFDAWYRAIRKLYVQAGVRTQEQADRMDADPMYAHLSRIGNVFDNDFQSFENFSETILKRSVGSGRGFQDPVISDITEIQGAAKRLVENEMLVHLDDKVSKNPLKEVSRGAPDLKPTTASKEEILAVLKKLDSSLPDSYLEEVGAVIDANPDIMTLWRPASIQAEHIRFFREGEAHYLRIDRNLQDAMGLIHDNMFVGGVWEYLKAYTKAKRLLATTFSVNFTVRNPVRDAFTAYFQAEKQFVPFLDSFKGLKHVINKDDLYWRGVLGGLEGSSLVSSDLNETMRNFDHATGKVDQGWASGLVDKMYAFSEGGEMATRFGVLGKYDVKNPAELAKGVMDARETTFNWSQRGKAGNPVSALNKFTAFFKARLIVMDKQIRTLGKKPGTVLKRGLPFTALSLFLSNLYKDDPEYQNLPVWRRLMSFNFKIGDHWLFIPLPDVYGLLFVSTPQFIYSEVQKRDPHLAKEFAKQALTMFAPATPDDSIPDLVKPVIEGMVNHSFFSGREIVPEYLKGVVPERQLNEYTSDMAVALSQAAKQVGIEWSPLMVDHYMRGYLISSFDLAKVTTNYTLDAFGVKLNEFRREYEVTDLPLVSGFVRREYEPASEYQVGKLLDKYRNAKVVHDSFLSLRKVDPMKALEFYNEHQKELNYYPAINAQYSTIKEYIGLYRTLQKSAPDSPQREARLNAIKDLILKQSQIANDIIETNFGL